MNREKKKKSAAPIYAIAAVWLLCTFWHPIMTLLRLLIVAALSLVGFGVVSRMVKEKQAKTEAAPQPAAEAPAEPVREAAKPEARAEAKPEAQPAAPKYPPEVQTVVDEGERAHAELQRLYASIPDLAVKKKVLEIMDVADKIIKDAIEDPSDVPQIKRFLDYYLPTTIKLLNAYDRMGAQGIEGSNISGTMQSINEMLDTAITAYKKLLDSLFANQAMDIETDINVMNTLLKREGLSAAGEGGLKF